MSKNKSVWDSCSTAHISLSGKMLATISTIGNNHGITQSKVVQMLLLESKTFNGALDDLTQSGIFDPCETAYEEYRKKQDFFEQNNKEK